VKLTFALVDKADEVDVEGFGVVDNFGIFDDLAGLVVSIGRIFSWFVISFLELDLIAIFEASLVIIFEASPGMIGSSQGLFEIPLLAEILFGILGIDEPSDIDNTTRKNKPKTKSPSSPSTTSYKGSRKLKFASLSES
jgi:hypothetical protein